MGDTERSIVNFEKKLPAKEQISVRNIGMVVQCVALRKISDQDASREMPRRSTEG